MSRVEKGWHSPQKSSESCLTIQAYARLVYANLFSSSLHTHTHGKGGDVNPARLPKFNAPLVFGRRVSATTRARGRRSGAADPLPSSLLFTRQILSSSLSYSILPSRFVARGSRTTGPRLRPFFYIRLARDSFSSFRSRSSVSCDGLPRSRRYLAIAAFYCQAPFVVIGCLFGKLLYSTLRFEDYLLHVCRGRFISISIIFLDIQDISL